MVKSLKDCAKEWLDTLVVAISVAMAFRAYFYEPFNIPTGSMQPTLYGNHYQPCEERGVMQTTPLKWFNWLATGRDYKEFVAPFAGSVWLAERIDGRYSLFMVLGSHKSHEISIPTDALTHLNLGSAGSGRTVVPVPRAGGFRVLHYLNDDGTLGPEVRVLKNTLLFSGYDTTGDFVFVNRWKWNFRLPARSDVMVFSTTGIDGLMQGTHYIKRVVGLPGEKVEIKPGKVFINDVEMPPLKPMVGKRGELTPEPNPGVNGRGGYAMNGPVEIGELEYFTCGDNSDNSLDSRYWGAVPEAKVTGNAACVFWPIVNPRWGAIK